MGGVLNSLVNFIFDRMHPIGSLYFSKHDIDPSQLFGGKWEKVSGAFLYAADVEHIAGSKFGSATKTLVSGNIPPHTHGFSATTSSNGSHQHVTGYRRRDTYASPGNADAMIWSKEAETVKSDFAGDHTHSVSGTTSASGSGLAFDIMPPGYSVNWWIRIA